MASTPYHVIRLHSYISQSPHLLVVIVENDTPKSLFILSTFNLGYLCFKSNKNSRKISKHTFDNKQGSLPYIDINSQQAISLNKNFLRTFFIVQALNFTLNIMKLTFEDIQNDNRLHNLIK